MKPAELLKYEQLAESIMAEITAEIERGNFEKVYAKVRPFLQFFSTFWFMPAKIKAVLTAFIIFCDGYVSDLQK